MLIKWNFHNTHICTLDKDGSFSGLVFFGSGDFFCLGSAVLPARFSLLAGRCMRDGLCSFLPRDSVEDARSFGILVALLGVVPTSASDRKWKKS